jgi:hypothetical protein
VSTWAWAASLAVCCARLAKDNARREGRALGCTRGLPLEGLRGGSDQFTVTDTMDDAGDTMALGAAKAVTRYR